MSLVEEIDQVIQEQERKNSRTAVRRPSMQRVRRPVNPTYFAVFAAWLIVRHKTTAPAIAMLGILGYFLYQPLIALTVVGVGLYVYASRKLKDAGVQQRSVPVQKRQYAGEKNNLTILNIFEEDVWNLIKKIKGVRKKLPGENESWKDWQDAFTVEQAARTEPRVTEQVQMATEDLDEYYFE
jgi:hypothetical protein